MVVFPVAAFNAERESYLLRPLKTARGLWQPLRDRPDDARVFPIRWLKGRPRAAALRDRGLQDEQAGHAEQAGQAEQAGSR